MRAVGIMVLALALLGGCRKKVEQVKTPVSQLAPLGGGLPAAQPAEAENDNSGAPQPAQPAAATPDGGAARTVITAPKTTTTPSVASPYVPGGGSQHLPMWKQRAKFY
jgi:hypothetical protein